MGILGAVGSQVAKRIGPGVGSGPIREVLERAIDGAGPIPGAAKAADRALRQAGGDTDAAIEALTSRHLKLAGAQGFLTNVGGLVTMAVAVPANIAGVLLLQSHLAAAILHLRGYDLSDPQVRDAVLVCLLEKDSRREIGTELGISLTPAAVATAAHRPELRDKLGRAATAQLISLSGGKQIARFVARRIPVLGGAIGGVGDAWATRRVAKEATRVPLAPTV